MTVMSDSQVFDAAVTEAHANDPVDVVVEETPVETPVDTDAAAAAIVDNVDAPADAPAEGEASTEENPDAPEEQELDENGQPVAKVDEPAETKLDTSDEEELEGIDTSLKAVQSMVEKSPELKAYASKHPEFQKQLGYMARKADRAKSYDEMFHSPSFARNIKIAADEMYRIDELYRGDDPKAFMHALIANSFVYDADGKPVIDPSTNQPQTDGSYQRIAEFWQEQFLGDVTAHAARLKETNHEAAQADGEELAAAIEVINRVLYGGKGPQASRAAKAAPSDDKDLEGLSPALRQEVLDARAARASAGTEDKSSLAAFETKVNGAVTTARDGYINTLLDNLVQRNPKIVMTDFMRKSIVRNVNEALTEKLSKDVAHRAAFKQYIKSVPRNDKGLATVVSSDKAMLRELAPRLLRSAFEEATSTVVKTAAAKTDKINAGLKNKNLPTTGGAKPSAVNRDEKVEKALADKVAANNGKRLSDKDVMDTVLGAYHDK